MMARMLTLLLFVSMLTFYPSHSGGETVQPDAAKGTKETKPSTVKEDQDKTKENEEYWCKRSAFHKKRVEQARNEVEREEALLSDLKDSDTKETGKDKKYSDKKIKKIEDNLANASKVLTEREKELARVMDEAKKKNIPPAWLQCEPEL